MHPKGENSMAASGLGSRNDLIATGRAISVLFGINRIRNKRSHLLGPHSRPVFQLQQVVISLKS